MLTTQCGKPTFDEGLFLWSSRFFFGVPRNDALLFAHNEACLEHWEYVIIEHKGKDILLYFSMTEVT